MKNLKSLLLLLFISNAVFAGIKQDKEGEIQRIFSKSVPVTESTLISLNNKFGDVSVKTWNESKVDITATIKVSSDRKSAKDLKEYLDGISISVESSGSELTITTNYPDWKFGNISMSVDYSVILPAKNSFTLENEFGDAKLTGIGGKVDATISHGNLTVTDCKNENYMYNRFGDIIAKNIGGPSRIDGSNGNVKVEVVAGKLNVKDKFGSVTVRDVKGDLILSSGNGDVKVSDVSESALITNSFGSTEVENIGKELTIESQNGDVDAINFQSGTINNSFGQVNVETVKGDGDLKINNQNGDIRLKSIKANVEIRNSFANTKIKDLNGNLKIKAQNCSVDADQVTGKIDIENSFGSVDITNSGSDVEISNQNGDVTVEDVKKAGKLYDLSSSFGSVKLTVPAGISASVHGETSFGEIESDFDLRIKEKFNKATMEGKIGSGTEAEIKLVSQNASVYLLKQK